TTVSKMFVAIWFWPAVRIRPALRVIHPSFGIPTGEHSIQILSVLEIFPNDDGGIRVVHDVLAELFTILQNVIDQTTEKHNVGTGAQRSPDISNGRSAAEARIHMKDLRTVFFRFHHPLKTYGVVLRHIRAHNKDGVSIHQVRQCSGGAAPSEGRAQTGHGRAVSYTSLSADADHAQPGGKQCFDQIVLFIVESRTAQMGDG